MITVAVPSTDVRTMYALREKLKDMGEYDLSNMESRQLREGEVTDYYFPVIEHLYEVGYMGEVFRDWARLTRARVIEVYEVGNDTTTG